jgi:hypothetical protein
VQTTEFEPLTNLRKLINNYCVSEPERDAYNQAIDELARCFQRVVSIVVVETSDVFVWFWRLPEGYLDLVRDKKPEALSIFAHFCVLLRRLEPTWYVDSSFHFLPSSQQDTNCVG